MSHVITHFYDILGPSPAFQDDNQRRSHRRLRGAPGKYGGILEHAVPPYGTFAQGRVYRKPVPHS